MKNRLLQVSLIYLDWLLMMFSSSAGRSQECQSQEDLGDQLDIIVTEEKHDEPNK